MDNNKNKLPPKPLRVFFATIIISIFIGLVIYLIVILSANNSNNGTTPGNFGNNQGTEILYRNATLSDITITEDTFDLAALGEKLVLNPNCDIKNLELTFEFVREKTIVKKIVKPIGNVNKGTQYTVTISITDLSFDIIFSSDIKCRYYVSNGTKTIFS